MVPLPPTVWIFRVSLGRLQHVSREGATYCLEVKSVALPLGPSPPRALPPLGPSYWHILEIILGSITTILEIIIVTRDS